MVSDQNYRINLNFLEKSYVFNSNGNSGRSVFLVQPLLRSNSKQWKRSVTDRYTSFKRSHVNRGRRKTVATCILSGVLHHIQAFGRKNLHTETRLILRTKRNTTCNNCRKRTRETTQMHRSAVGGTRFTLYKHPYTSSIKKNRNGNTLNPHVFYINIGYRLIQTRTSFMLPKSNQTKCNNT